MLDSMFSQMFRTKAVGDLIPDGEHHGLNLKRALRAKDLIALGVGAIIGAGIFTTTGTAAAGTVAKVPFLIERPGAGPAVVLSYILVAIACAFCALCYAEFASMVPVAGSAYTYSYATMGELVAWIIGWDLVLEYAVGNVAVAISWSEYLKTTLASVGLHLPDWISTAPEKLTTLPADEAKALADSCPHLFGHPIIFNLPASLIVLALTVLLVRGIRESATANNLLVLLKLAIIALFLGVGIFHVQAENYTPFMPNGFGSVALAAGIIFFAYIGFDAVSTVAEETENPGRNLPIGMIGSLVLCTLIYIAVSGVLCGLAPWHSLGVGDPMATVFQRLHMPVVAGIIAGGAVISLTAVLLVFQIGQPRIFYSMSRDGLLPGIFAAVHPVYQTPHVTTILTGVLVAFGAGFMDLSKVVELTNIGTLFAFVLVCLGVIILRYQKPEIRRPFACPAVPLVPILGIVSCLYLMSSLPLITWYRFAIWLVVGFVIYFGYGAHHSKLRS